MDFRGFNDVGSAEFVAKDSEIATARVGFLATRDKESLKELPYPSLGGRSVNSKVAELIVGGNVALLDSVGSLARAIELDNVKFAVRSGIEALEIAANEQASAARSR